MFHRNNANMILNHRIKYECMNIQHSYNDIFDVIVDLCSINYMIFFVEGSKSAPTLSQATVDHS